MTKTYRIIRRAFSVHQTISMDHISYISALVEADRMERAMKDGEYIVRASDEPDHIYGHTNQPYMD